MNKMPVIWYVEIIIVIVISDTKIISNQLIFPLKIYRQKYCTLLTCLCKGTETRKAFDRALQALPVTQHKAIWDQYIKWIREFGCQETSITVYRRYLMFDPSQRETFVKFLEENGLYQEAARQLTQCVDDPHYVSPIGSSRHQLWMKLCDLCATHVEAVSGDMNVEAIIRSGIAKFSDEVGRLWTRLADFYVHQGLFDKARDVYEEALASVVTVKDFTIVFDKYVKVEEKVLAAKLQWVEELEAEIEEAGEDCDEETLEEKEELTKEVDIRLARIEHMLSRRPLLLSSVVLRQNPHNVYEWLKRVKVLREQAAEAAGTTSGTAAGAKTATHSKEEAEEDEGDAILSSIYRDQIAHTFAEAIKTVDPDLAVGKFSHLWLAFAKFYERQKDLDSARSVYKKAVAVEFKSVEELANVWCAYAEMEMKYENYEEALILLQKVVSDPPRVWKAKQQAASAKSTQLVISSEDVTEAAVTRLPASAQIHKNVKVWGLYLDLEEGVGTLETCRAAYERAIDLKVATPQFMLNYATYLEERNYFDDSFRVYEKAVTMFVFPPLRIIWITYIDKFVERYGGTKIERLRDMFENALTQVPEEFAPEFYIKYAKTEEDLGLSRQAIAVYERATRAVGAKDRLNMYRLYAKKTEQFYGITKTRPVYERALQELSDDDARELCIEFSEMETKLGEVDRARAILQYGSQFAPPALQPAYWTKWREFEESHGNEDTYREMLRIRRSVETAFSQTPMYLSMIQQSAAGAGLTVADAGNKRPAEPGMVSFLPAQKKQAV